MKTQRGDGMLAYILALIFGTTRMAELEALHIGPTSHIRIYLGTHFC
jgi:hypothetical protein